MSQRPDAGQSLLLVAAGRAVCTTTWAVPGNLGAPVATTGIAGFVEVVAGLDHPDAQVPAHLSPPPVATRLTRHRNQALAVDHPELADRAHADTDDLTTTAPSVLDHVRDDLATTATAIATAIANVLDDNPEILSRHWHPAVPFPRAAVTGTAEAAKATPC